MSEAIAHSNSARAQAKLNADIIRARDEVLALFERSKDFGGPFTEPRNSLRAALAKLNVAVSVINL